MNQQIKERRTQIQNGEVPQGYKKTKVGIVPSEWDIQTIDSILTKIGRKVDVKQDTLYQQIGIRSHGKGIFYKDLASGESLGDKSVFWIEPNCLIVNIVFAWEQAVARTTDFEKGMIGSHRFPMYFPKENKSDIDYLVYFFMTKRGKLLLEDASPGGAGRNKTLGQKEFAQSKLTTPPLPEQQKIAEILTTQDKLIELKEKLIAEKEQQKKYLMQNLLTGKKRLKGFSGEWKKVKLGEICEYSSSSLSLSSLENYKGEKIYPVYDANKIFAYIDKYEMAKQYVSIIKDGASVGRLNLCQENSTVIGTMGYLCNNDLSIIKFIYYRLMLINFNNYVNGSTIPHVYFRDYKLEKLSLPPLDEQNAIAEILSTADREIKLLKADLAEEKQKKKALMQLLLTGIVRV